MSCDCLTKDMSEDYLLRILDTNVWNVAQTEEAKAVKLRKAAGVQRRKAERAGAETDQSEAAYVTAEEGASTSASCAPRVPSDGASRSVGAHRPNRARRSVSRRPCSASSDG